jgi:hypothetical protein
VTAQGDLGQGPVPARFRLAARRASVSCISDQVLIKQVLRRRRVA